MPQHECETSDFPEARGLLNYKTKKKVVKAVGGTGLIALKEAIDEAKAQAEADGEAALKNDTCGEGCEKFVFVDISIDKIDWKWGVGKKSDELSVDISGIWKAGILCVKKPKKGK